MPGRDPDLIEGFLRRYGEWGWDEACFIASILPEGARVLDVGAYLGTFGLGVALLRPLGALCAVEANPAMLPCLAANLRLAPCPATAIEAMAAAPGAPPRPGAAPADNASAASFVPGAPGNPVAASARTVTLEQLRADHGPFDLIKLDVEGMEAELLQSDAAFLAGGTTGLWVECNEDPRALELCALLLGWGLQVHLFAAPVHNPDSFGLDPAPTHPWSYEAGLLAAPGRAPRLDPDLQRHHCILRRIGSVTELEDALWRIPRWGMADWPLDDPAALAALAGRTIRNQPRDGFLRSAAPLGSRDNEMMWQRLMAAEARAAAAEAQLAELGQAMRGGAIPET
ncbi:MAG TPA: FkbM family methyltransferase [Acetobacteraceae bacterium]